MVVEVYDYLKRNHKGLVVVAEVVVNFVFEIQEGGGGGFCASNCFTSLNNNLIRF